MNNLETYKTDSEKELNEKNEEKKQGKKLVSNLIFFLAPIMTLITMEILRAPYISRYFDSGEVNAIIKYILTYGIILSLQFMLSKLFVKRIIGVYLTNIILYILAFATTVMVIITGDPLMPVDLVQVKAAGDIMNFIKMPWKPYMVYSVVALVVTLAIYTFFEIKFHVKPKKNLLKNIILTVISVAVFAVIAFSICLSKNVNTYFFEKIDLKVSGYYTVADYQKNGFLLTFMSHFRDLSIDKPDNYSDKVMFDIRNKYPEINDGFAKEFDIPEQYKNPNVIAIQSESLWDPAKMDKITLSEDPLKCIKGFSEEFPVGTLVSPVFGCNTCVPEFEFLTGFSTANMNSGTYPYSQYVHRKIPSLVSNFAENGYTVQAVHTYDKYFYNRNKAYKLMGFEKFIGKNDLEEPEVKGTYISDMEFVRQVIKMYEEKGDKPLFLYGITMQNHGNYLEKRYDTYDVTVDSEVLSENDLQGLRDAVQGVYDADKSFYALTEYFSQVDEPTIIVLYGDHLPFLGLNSSTYFATEFLKSDNLAENPQIYETPYIVWANFDISDIKIPKRVSPANLGAQTLKLAGLEKVDWHMRFIDLFYSKTPVYKTTVKTDENGEYTEEYNREMEPDYAMIQFDCLSGEKYCNR